MDLGGVLGSVGLFGVLLLVNAFFVAAEYAIVRVRVEPLQEHAKSGSLRARRALLIVNDLERYISTVQVGVTAASLALGYIGEPAVSQLIAPAFGWMIGFSEPLFHLTSLLLAFGLITYLTLVVGELAPKYVAIQRTTALALWVAYPLYIVSVLLHPVVWIADRSARRVVGLLRIRGAGGEADERGEALRAALATLGRRGALREPRQVVLRGALEFGSRLVRQAMLPRTEMVAVAADTKLPVLRALIARHRVPAVPVYRSNIDDVIGLVHLRDLAANGSEDRTAEEIMRPPLVVPETMRLDQAVEELQKQGQRAGIVVDEFGGTAGLLTSEGVLEELVGDWRDDRGRPEAVSIRAEAAGSLLVDGLTTLRDVEDALDLELQDEPYDTLGGLVFGRLGRTPTVGDRVEIDGWELEVTAIDGHRVAEVRAASGKA